MSERKRLGLRIILWVANVLLSGELTPYEEEKLEHIRVSLNVGEFQSTE